jgi:hypothetical protein
MAAQIEMPGAATPKMVRREPTVLGLTRSRESRHSLTRGYRIAKMKLTRKPRIF